MTRFRATDPAERQRLFADAIRAHRERASAYLTVETDCGDDEMAPPWMQFADGVYNLDCTDDELDRLKGVLETFPAFTIDQLTSPEEATGTNVRISAMVDENRLAQFFERVFRTVYDCPETYVAWVTEI